MAGLLRARDVAFAYPGSAPDAPPVLAGVTLTVVPGARLGVVGENGSGKSTLLGLLAGALDPTAGRITRVGELAVVEQEFPLSGSERIGDLVDRSLARVRAATAQLEATLAGPGDPRAVADALARYEALTAWDADRVLDEALTRLGAPRDRDRLLSRLSTGERYRVRLACRLAEGTELLLLDEPTNHLDGAAVDYLTQRLRSWPGAVVVVTHDRALLDDVATAVLDLDPTVDGRVAVYGARRGRGGRDAFSYADYRYAKAASLMRWRRRYRREQERLRELWSERDRAYENLSDEWRPPKGSQRHRRGTRARQHVKAADRAHAALEAAAVAVPPPPPELVLPELPAAPPGWSGGPDSVPAPLLAVDGAHVPGRLDRPDLSVRLGPGGRLLVVGANGSGKSTLLGLLARAAAPGVRVGVLTQEPDFGPGELLTGEAIATQRILAAAAAGLIDPEQVVPLAGTGLVGADLLDRPTGELSSGQRRRLDLALTLMLAPHVLVLDEPTNHLAVDLMDALTDWLVRTPAAVVVATHDRAMGRDLRGAGEGGAAPWPTISLDPAR